MTREVALLALGRALRRATRPAVSFQRRRNAGTA